MRKSVAIILGLLMMSFGLGACSLKEKTGDMSPDTKVEATKSVKEGRLKVYTSFYPMYDFTKKIVGDKAEVINLVPAGTEPHDWEPSPTDIASLKEGDIFVYNGAGMEHWVEKIIDSIGTSNLEIVEASYNLDIIKDDHHDDEDKHIEDSETKDEREDDHQLEEAHEDEHDHGEFDPHVWLSPIMAKAELKNIKDALVKVDASHASYYEANYEKYAKALDELDQAYQGALEKIPAEKKSIVVSHEAYAYLCEAYGLTQVGIQGISAEAEPDAKRMAEITEFVKDNGVKVIFTEELLNSKIGDTIAKETGAKVLQLNPIEGLTKEQLEAGEDYISIMKKNLEALLEAFQ